MTLVRIGRPGRACDIFQVSRLPGEIQLRVGNPLGARFAQDDEVDLAIAGRIGKIGPQGAIPRRVCGIVISGAWPMSRPNPPVGIAL